MTSGAVLFSGDFHQEQILGLLAGVGDVGIVFVAVNLLVRHVNFGHAEYIYVQVNWLSQGVQC